MYHGSSYCIQYEDKLMFCFIYRFDFFIGNNKKKVTQSMEMTWPAGLHLWLPRPNEIMHSKGINTESIWPAPSLNFFAVTYRSQAPVPVQSLHIQFQWC